MNRRIDWLTLVVWGVPIVTFWGGLGWLLVRVYAR
jgi:hypothetical protein